MSRTSPILIRCELGGDQRLRERMLVCRIVPEGVLPHDATSLSLFYATGRATSQWHGYSPDFEPVSAGAPVPEYGAEWAWTERGMTLVCSRAQDLHGRGAG